MPSTCPEGDDVNVNFFLMDFKEGIYILRKKKWKVYGKLCDVETSSTVVLLMFFY